MPENTYVVKMFGHSLELKLVNNNRVGEAYKCVTCGKDDCSQIARFNKYYQLRIDPKSPKGWHIVEAK